MRFLTAVPCRVPFSFRHLTIYTEFYVYRVRTAQGKPGKPGKRGFWGKIRENSGNFILLNISNQIGCALRINE